MKIMFCRKSVSNMLNIPKPVVAFTAMSAGFAMMHSVFSFYYVKIFLERYRISPGWFQAAQSLYLVWNAINDPLFAYIQDSVKFKFLKTRRKAILYTAPFFSLSFLLPWFPWETQGEGTWITGLHLVIALALYDSFFTFIGLAACCLFTEISSQHNDRLSLVRISSVGHLIGASIGVYSCEFASNSLANYANFQWTCVGIAICSCMLMIYTGLHAHTEFDRVSQLKEEDSLLEDDDEKSHSRVSGYTIWQLTWHILTNRNFLCFVIVNFFQCFHRTWMSNFSVIITHNLIPESAISPGVRRMFHGLLNSISSILIICAVSIVSYFGAHKIIMWNFYVKIINGLFLFFCGYSNPWILMTCMLIDYGYSGAAFSLFNMSLSDVADEDMHLHKRKHPISSMVFGTNALIVKPADSLSPMVVAYILNSYGYMKLTDKSGSKLTDMEYGELKGAMFAILCFMPVLIAVIQIFAWSGYRLRNTHRSQPVNNKESENISLIN